MSVPCSWEGPRVLRGMSWQGKMLQMCDTTLNQLYPQSYPLRTVSRKRSQIDVPFTAIKRRPFVQIVLMVIELFYNMYYDYIGCLGKEKETHGSLVKAGSLN